MQNASKMTWFLATMALFLAGNLIFTACEKDLTDGNRSANICEFSDFGEQSSNLMCKVYNSDFGLDAEDVQVNRNMLTLALALRKSLSSPTLNKKVFDLATQKASKNVAVREAIGTDEALLGSISQEVNMVNEKLSAQGNRSKFSYSAIVQPFTRGKHTYTPSIYLLNSATAKSDLSPIISSGLEIDDEDNILGWQANPDGTFKEIIVSEESSKSTSAPIYIMDIASDIDQKNLQAFLDLSRIEYRDDDMAQGRVMLKIASHRYRDNMRYDWSGREEFWIVGAALNSGDIGFDFLSICSTCITQPFLEITEIEPGDLNKDLFKWFTIDWNVNVPNWQTTNIYFNLFERDWQYSFKDMGVGQKFPGGNIVGLSAQTKYADHWLMYDPSAGFLPAVPMSDINANWLWTASSPKAELDWWRVD